MPRASTRSTLTAKASHGAKGTTALKSTLSKPRAPSDFHLTTPRAILRIVPVTLSDEDVQKLVRGSKHGAGFYAAVIGTILTVLASAAAVGKWVFTAPTAEDYKSLSDKTTAVTQDHAVLKANVDGLRQDVSSIKNGQERFEDNINVKIDRLLDRSRR